MIRVGLVLASCLLLQSCYYMQAVSGQMEVLRKREPLQDVLDDPESPPERVAKLRLLQEARDFSVRELHLPDNKSYRTFADIDRDFVAWNVLAAPEFSVQPKTWCFPVAGCVSYRGYFKRDAAMRAAQQLRDEGLDVAVGGVPAYSTLGKFNDPILSTMLGQSDVALVGMLFHELAHQVLYVKDDSQFNESFATAVEEFGLQRWLATGHRNGSYEQYLAERRYRTEIAERVLETRRALEALYQAELSIDEMRQAKQRALLELSARLATYAEEQGREPPGWFSPNMNNAHLISTNLYEGRLPEFRALLEACDSDIECFYAAAEQLAHEEN